MIKISCQEQLLPGQTLQEKFEFARGAGYDGIELRGRGDFAFRDRLPELRRAARAGVPMPSVCVDMLHFLGAFDPDLRRDAVAQLKSQLSVIAEIGGVPPAVAGRWDQTRLNRTFLRLAVDRQVDPVGLVTHVMPVEEAAAAYRMLDRRPHEALQVVLKFS